MKVVLAYGYSRTTMDDIARAAEMSRPALYLLFRNKAEIYRAMQDLLETFTPDELAIEEVFVARNPATSLKLGQARGVAIAAVVSRDLPVAEYAARRVKLAVTGTGRATKDQVQHMVRVLLRLPGAPAADAADALAIAICHVNTARVGASGPEARVNLQRRSARPARP